MFLPQIITDLIISYLDLKSVLVLSRVNKFWYHWTGQGLKELDTTDYNIYSDISVILKRFNKLQTLKTQNTFSGKLECLRVLILNDVQKGTSEFTTFLSFSRALNQLRITKSIEYQNEQVLFTLADCTPCLIILEIDQAYDITNHGLNTLLKGCKALKELTIMNCPNVTEDAFMNITNLNLSSLNLGKCRLVDDNLLTLVSQTCPKLMNLDISNDSLISDLSSLSDLKYLKSLKVSGCYLLNDEAFTQFRSDSIRDLDISFCNSITDHGLSYILSNCLCINTINVQEASGISIKGIEHACKSNTGFFYGSILELK